MPKREMTQEEMCLKQMEKIQTYRNISMQPELTNALDIIVEMEMGGTKAELMDKLNALEF